MPVLPVLETLSPNVYYINPKSHGLMLFHFFLKMRALWSEHIKNKVFLGFLKSFLKMDIYKCPKSVFESKIWKKVCIFILPIPDIL